MAHGQDRATTSIPYSAWIERRARGEPIAYILGCREFYGIEFEVNEHVLIPRPETELLVETALNHLPKAGPSKILDLGTGSGCIAVAIASHAPHCDVLGIDASLEALSVAARNLQRHGLENLDLLHSDWYDGLGDLRFDVIVSNPPYVAAGDAYLQQGDLRFEPRLALTPGSDGLEAIERIAEGAPSFLEKNGWLMVEHGHDQAVAVCLVLQKHGFRDLSTLCDLASIPRITFGCHTP